MFKGAALLWTLVVVVVVAQRWVDTDAETAAVNEPSGLPSIQRVGFDAKVRTTFSRRAPLNAFNDDPALLRATSSSAIFTGTTEWPLTCASLMGLNEDTFGIADTLWPQHCESLRGLHADPTNEKGVLMSWFRGIFG